MRTLIPCTLLFLAACQQPAKQNTKSDGEPEIAAPLHTAWTEAFNKKAILFADEIVLDGPRGIIAHAGMRVDDEIHVSTTKTTKDGLLQETHLAPGADGEIHAFLDNWELIAFKRITILERVVPCDVKLRARGDVRFVDQVTNEEQRGSELSFEGKIPR
jgi:hypothetical protein